jgi:hypothetical protein
MSEVEIRDTVTTNKNTISVELPGGQVVEVDANRTPEQIHEMCSQLFPDLVNYVYKKTGDGTIKFVKTTGTKGR